MTYNPQNIIELCYAESIRAAAEIEQTGRDILQVSQSELQETLQYLGQNWTGESSALCIQKGQSLSECISESGVNIVKTAALIRRIAETVYHAEQQALSLISH